MDCDCIKLLRFLRHHNLPGIPISNFKMHIKKVLIIICAVFLFSCGYHLRGSVNVPDEMRRVYVQNASPDLHSAFGNVLQYSEGAMVNSLSEAGMVVNVLDERMNRRAISLSGTGKANEFELHYLLDYQLLDDQGGALTPVESIDLIRNYFNQQDQVIGKANEEQVIREEMYRQAVQAIVRKAQVKFK